MIERMKIDPRIKREVLENAAMSNRLRQSSWNHSHAHTFHVQEDHIWYPQEFRQLPKRILIYHIYLPTRDKGGSNP
jgi:hypothetical protein